MTLYQFNLLDEMDQGDAVWRGVQISQRDDGTHTILLYKIDDFFVEVIITSKIMSSGNLRR